MDNQSGIPKKFKKFIDDIGKYRMTRKKLPGQSMDPECPVGNVPLGIYIAMIGSPGSDMI